jgi:uncharacterized protein (TIGR02271 family)
MLMPDIDTVRGWQGRTMVDGGGDRIGSIEGIYTDDQSGEPEWALVNTGLFGTKSTFVPIVQASERNGDVQVPYDKQLVKDAPRIEADQHLSEAEEQQLWRHYGLDYGAGQAGTAAQRQPDTEEIDRPVGAAAGGRRAGDDTAGRGVNEAMTRSEEELRVGTETRQRGRARLRRYVTTETQQITVPVQREEVRVEREPITDANLDDATSGPDISEDEHEVVLHEERPVVDKEVVPRERVRLDTETVTEERQVGEEVRKEQIEVDEGDTDVRDDRRP